MLKFLLVFGLNFEVNKKKIFARKRLFHKGYQISSINVVAEGTEQHKIYTLIKDVPTFKLLQEFLRDEENTGVKGE